jgi:hypothetical protein
MVDEVPLLVDLVAVGFVLSHLTYFSGNLLDSFQNTGKAIHLHRSRLRRQVSDGIWRFSYGANLDVRSFRPDSMRQLAINDADADAIQGQHEGKYKAGGSTARLHGTSANVPITK